MEKEDFDDPQAELAEKREEKILYKIDLLSEQYLALRKRATLLTVTILTAVIAAVFVVLVVYLMKKPLADLEKVQLVFGGLLIIVCIMTVVVIILTYAYSKSIRYVSVGLWGIMFSWIMTGSLHSTFTITTVLAIIIILLYVIFPVPMLWAVIGGCLATVAQGFWHIRAVDDHPDHLEHFVIIISELCCLLTANIFGVYIKGSTDRFHQQTFTQTYEDLKVRMELEEERQRQEQLLLSIIPADLAHQMRHSMLDKLTVRNETSQTNELSPKRLWHEFYVREHKQVSILFADLVNFTQLTTRCTAKDLVTMLNEIYGRFDSLARFLLQMNDCMRIKTLGDCYCCVSGMPVSRPHHAENVVKTGLEMIQAIKSIRESTTSILDMRVGVHSGNVLCGVLGMVKWKYDIWSDDVVYANFLESSGVPGKIHISRATMIQLAGAYTVTEVEPAVIDAAGESQLTYFVKEVNNGNPRTIDRKTSFQRTQSFSNNSSTQQLYSFLQSWGAPKPFENLTSIKHSNDTIPSRSYEMLEASVHSEFLSRSLCNDCDSRITCHLDKYCFELRDRHKNEILDTTYMKLRSDSSLCLSITSFLYFLFTTILNVTIFNSHYAVKLTSGLGLIFIGFILYFYVKRKYNQNKKPSQIRHSQVAYYLLLTYTVLINISSMLVTHFYGVSLENHSNCSSEYTKEVVGREADLIMMSLCGDLLMVIPVFMFIYTSSLLKLLIIVISWVILMVVLVARQINYFSAYTDLLEQESHEGIILNIVVAIGCYLFITVVMLLYSKQMESGVGTLITWRTQFAVENVEVERMKNLTKLLLLNILPQHVATYYLERQIFGELYHESYDNVCIMFATVVNFDEFFKMSSNCDREHQCLRLLNEIIGDFDLLLSKPKYSLIEKMKTVGSTYMAAAGLQPGKDMDNGITNPAIKRTTQQFVQTMTDFALALFTVLDNINTHSFNDFHLRIGLSHGPVIAGVVGAQKPLYDVWGDTVNMASRMDTGGLIDTIQMTENTAQVLEAINYPVVCRGQMAVKGKHELVTTYLLEPLKNPQILTAATRERASVSDYIDDTVC